MNSHKNTVRPVHFAIGIVIIVILTLLAGRSEAQEVGNFELQQRFPHITIEFVRRDLSMRLDEICLVVRNTELPNMPPVTSCKLVTSDEPIDISGGITLNFEGKYENTQFEAVWVELDRMALNMNWLVFISTDPTLPSSVG